MTMYEILIEAQHRECQLADQYIADMERRPDCTFYVHMFTATVRRIEALNIAIDNLPVSLAELEL